MAVWQARTHPSSGCWRTWLWQEHRGRLGVDPAGDELRGGDPGAAAQHLGVGRHGERVQVGDEVVGVEVLLQADPVHEGAEEVAEVEGVARRLHPGEDARACGSGRCGGGHGAHCVRGRAPRLPGMARSRESPPGRRHAPAGVRSRPRGSLVGPGPGQPDRRAHRLQRRARAADRPAPPHGCRVLAARRRPPSRVVGADRRAGRGGARRRRAGHALAAGGPTWPGCCGRCGPGGSRGARARRHRRQRRAGRRRACRARRPWSARWGRRPATCSDSACSPTTPARARLAAACVRAENDIAGAPTGGMDQSAALLCRADHALLLDCRSGATEHVPFDLAGRRHCGRQVTARHPGTCCW